MTDSFERTMENLDTIEGAINHLHRLLKASHDKLDDLNAQFGEKGDLCLCCHAQRHHGDVGIIHRNHCLIVRLRPFAHD